jgi:Ca2+/Na+ antiporter
MYFINSLRLLAVILLVSILIIKEIPFKNVVKDAMIQFYMALTCILILLIVDNILGFILSICLLTLYFRIYTTELKSIKMSSSGTDTVAASAASASAASAAVTENSVRRHGEHGHICNGSADKCNMNMTANLNIDRKIRLVTEQDTSNKNDGLVPYITEENLLAAQSNIVNALEYNKEVPVVDKGIGDGIGDGIGNGSSIGNLYGTQGLDTKNIHLRGYDTSTAYLGSLSYDIL